MVQSRKILAQIHSPKRALQLIALLGVALTLSAFVLEYGVGVQPCTMCWWQRYAHWAVALLGGISFYFLPARLGLFVAGAPVLIGLGIAGWQSLAQLGVLELPAVCGGHGALLASAGDDLLAHLQTAQPAPACDEIGFTLFGLSLAMWNVLIMLSALGYIRLVLITGKQPK